MAKKMVPTYECDAKGCSTTVEKQEDLEVVRFRGKKKEVCSSCGNKLAKFFGMEVIPPAADAGQDKPTTEPAAGK